MLWTNVAAVLLGFSIFATFVMATQVLQAPVGTGYGFGLSITLAGVLLLPIGGSMVVFSSVSARISQARGPRTTVLLGAALLTVGNAGFAMLPSSLWLAIGTATVGAIGAALAYSALPLLVQPDPERRGTSAARPACPVR